MSTIGDRIRQARVAAGLNLRELAEKAAPLSATAISKYERDEDVPRAPTLQRLARALGVSSAYFFRRTEVTLACPRYRRNSKFGVRAQETVEERIKEQVERYVEVEAAFPEGRFEPPDISRADACEVRSLEEAEDVAELIRKRWDLGTGPIENVAETLEDHGLKVLLIDAPEGFDGLSCWANDSIPVVVANGAKSWDRQRFDLAHELGELLLHATNGVDQEKAAHRFAAAFLAPRAAVYRELGRSRVTLSLDELRLLKQEYGLSVQAWIYRAYALDVIAKATFERLFRLLSMRGMRKDEGTTPREPDRARRFELLVRQAEAERLLTPSRAAELLGVTPRSARPRYTLAQLQAAAAGAGDLYSAGETDEWTQISGETLADEAG